MTPSQFRKVARENGLTPNELVKLNICQSEVYHAIRFQSATDSAETSFALEAALSSSNRKTLNRLADKGLIAFEAGGRRLKVTKDGWRIPCNAGATVFYGSCTVEDILKELPLDPITRFGPQLYA